MIKSNSVQAKGGVSMSEIHIQNLTRDYGLGKGIFDISIQVEKGEVFGFLGPNGAGKTGRLFKKTVYCCRLYA